MNNILHTTGILLLLGFLLGGCTTEESSLTEKEVPAISVQARLVTPHSIDIIDTYTGTVEGIRQADLYAKVAEAVSSVHVRENDAVSARTVLLRLDSTGSGANYLAAKSLYENASKQLRKMEYLYREGATSEALFDAAETEFNVRKAEFLAIAQLINIETPIDGIVTSLDVAVGDYVQPGQKLATVAVTDQVRVKFEVNEKNIGSIAPRAPIHFIDEYSGEKLTGRVNTISRSSNPLTRTFKVEALFDNVKGNLSPGTFIKLSYVKESMVAVLTIPRKAVLMLEGKPAVYTVNGDKAQRNDISLGDEYDGQVVITAGLQNGDTLVVLGQDYLEDNAPISISTWDK